MKNYFERFKDLKFKEERSTAKFEKSAEKRRNLVELIKSSPIMSFKEAFEKFGKDGIATMYELAMIRKEFYNSGYKEDIKEDLGKSMYQWCGEFLSQAPIDHPAYPKVIMAKIVGLKDNMGVKDNRVVPSETEFVICNHLRFNDSGYILEFREINGLMVPFTDMGYFLKEDYDENKDKGYGTLAVTKHIYDHLKKLIMMNCHPICHRPYPWADFSGFNSCDNPVDDKRTVITRESLRGIL